MSYGGSSTSVTVPPKPQPADPSTLPNPAAGPHACRCHDQAPQPAPAKAVTLNGNPSKNGFPTTADGRPDFGRMDVAQRLDYHRERLGLGR